MANRKYSAIVWLIVAAVSHVQCNDPPTMTNTEVHFTVKENATIGTVLFTLRATDDDAGDELTFITYRSWLGQDETPLLRLGPPTKIPGATINTWTCDIILNGVLDRDNSAKTRKLHYEVKDQSATFQYSVTMIITDVNDNPPSFTDLPYRASVKESAPNSTVIFQVSATDPDDGRGGTIQYSMKASNDADEAEYSKTFSLNHSSGKVTLIRELDYKQQSFYHFKVSAKDNGDPPCPGDSCLCNSIDINYCKGNPVDLFITIIDEQNSPPVFDKLPYYATITESMPEGSQVIQIEAVDGDRGVARPNNISFSIKNESYIPFEIHENTGVIIVAEKLDADKPDVRSSGGLYSFYVIATEEMDGLLTTATSTTQVTITVTDVNDNLPMFEKSVYEAEVIENTPKGVPLSLSSTITVTDKDQGVNSLFKLSIEKDNGEPDSDFETVPSKDQTVSGSTTVTIIVVNSTLLDYETIKKVTIKLVAKQVLSDGTISNTSTSQAIVNVVIKDANDHNPVFTNGQTSFHVSEHTKINSEVAQITATDVDSGGFGEVIFSLENAGSEPFSINETGWLSVEKDLDREHLGLYSLMVVAMDNPSEPESQRRRTLQRISIFVDDINDNGPKWTPIVQRLSVSETAKIGHNVGYIGATDKDVGQNAELEYSIEADTIGAKLFGVNKTSTGLANVFVRQNLTGHSRNSGYSVTFIATDKGEQPNSANISINIAVIDVNLHRPEFEQPYERNITIKEEREPGTFVANFNATDKDKGENAEVEYRLVTSSDGSHFRINVTTGNLFVEDKLDKETQSSYKIQIEARDKGQPTQLSTTIAVTVHLIDINDNEPSYEGIRMPYKMEVAEENPNATIGTVLEAIDKDSSADNAIICYYIYGGENLDLISLEKKTGNLSLRGRLDRESITQFDIVIKASSNCEEVINPISSTINDPGNSEIVPPNMYNESDPSLLWIHIKVLDINDHRPVFTSKEFSAGVIYDVDIGSVALSLMGSVTDEDTRENSKHLFILKEYKASPEMAQNLDTRNQAFNLSKYGNITTAIRFRPDMLGFFLLKVMVYDKDELSDTAYVKIYIVSNLQRVKLVFSKQPNEVEKLKEQLFKDLSKILDLQIIADKVVTHINSDGSNDPTKTDVFIHGRYANGEVVAAYKLWKAFDFNPSASSLLSRNGVLQAKDLTPDDDDDGGSGTDRVFAIIVAVLACTLVALSLVFLNMMRIYRRRLRAATTKAFSSPKEQEMYEHPGTNKYYCAENPLFGKEVKNPELDEDDKLSTNSLDVNAVDKFLKTNAEPDEEQEVVLQINDSALSTPQHNNNGHLDKVLQEYENSMKSKELGHKISKKNIKSNKTPISGGHISTVIPGLGTEIQEGVTRFSDENLSGDSGFPDGENTLSMSKGYLEYSDI